MIKFDSIVAGDRLIDVHSYRMGNTTMRCLGLWYVDVISVDAERRSAVVRWNSNRPETWHESRLKRLHRKPPKKYTDQAGK